MRRGDIAPNVMEDMKILVVDWDLLFSIKYKFLRLGFYPVFDEYNRKVIRFLKAADRDFEKIVIGVVVNGFNKSAKIDYVLNNVLFLPYTIIRFENEEIYKSWINIISPVIHLASVKRRYYHSTASKYFTELDF